MRAFSNGVAIAAALAVMSSTVAWSQVQPAGAPAAPVAVVVAPPPAAGPTLLIPDGTELHIRFEDDLSSKTSVEGDRFAIVLDEPVTLSDGFVIPRGYRGVGEVTHAQKNGMLGKGGELNVRFNYLSIGDTRIHLRGSQGKEGDGALGATIVLTVLFGPLGLLMKGKNIEIKRGQVVTAYVDANASVPMPIAAPAGA